MEALSMGIINRTPDSFFQSDLHTPIETLKNSMGHFDVTDIGAESTRPGAAPLSIDEEISRLEPLFSALQ